MIVNIPGIFDELVERVSQDLERPVYFKCGSRKEVVQHLTMLSQGISTQDKKYPLVWLVFPYTRSFNDRDTEYCQLPDLAIYIATPTKQNSSTEQRIEDNFIPTLYPIYNALISQIEQSGYFTWDGFKIPHQVIDWPFWGEPEGSKDVNPLNDLVDAMLIKNLNLIVNLETCESHRLGA